MTHSLCSQYFLLRKHSISELVTAALQISDKGILSLFLQWKRNTKTFCDACSLGTDGDVGDWEKQTAALIWPRTVTRAACCSASHHQSNDSWIYNEAYGEMIEDTFYSEQKKKWTLQSVLAARRIPYEPCMSWM